MYMKLFQLNSDIMWGTIPYEQCEKIYMYEGLLQSYGTEIREADIWSKSMFSITRCECQQIPILKCYI